MVVEASPKPRWCACSCGAQVTRTFAPGHDARLKSVARKVKDGELPKSKLPRNRAARDFLKKHRLV